MTYKTVLRINSLKEKINKLDEHIATHLEKRERLQGELDMLRETVTIDKKKVLGRARSRKKTLLKEIERIEQELGS